jgi:hypothetical protein
LEPNLFADDWTIGARVGNIEQAAEKRKYCSIDNVSDIETRWLAIIP